MISILNISDSKKGINSVRIAEPKPLLEAKGFQFSTVSLDRLWGWEGLKLKGSLRDWITQLCYMISKKVT